MKFTDILIFLQNTIDALTRRQQLNFEINIRWHAVLKILARHTESNNFDWQTVLQLIQFIQNNYDAKMVTDGIAL